jgi:hypothetical protein
MQCRAFSLTGKLSGLRLRFGVYIIPVPKLHFGGVAVKHAETVIMRHTLF